MQGFWLSILEYANYRKVSISTVRRYIKSNRVQSKKEDGKFFIFVSNENYEKRQDVTKIKEEEEIARLNEQIRSLKEENNDLKMLVDLYENSNKNSNENAKTHHDLPEIPIS